MTEINVPDLYSAPRVLSFNKKNLSNNREPHLNLLMDYHDRAKATGLCKRLFITGVTPCKYSINIHYNYIQMMRIKGAGWEKPASGKAVG